MSFDKKLLQQLFSLAFAILLSIDVYSQTDTTTAIVTGKIIKISYLVKDWNADGDKIYHIYWAEIILQNCKFQNPENNIGSTLPDTLVFDSPRSGLEQHMLPYQLLKEGDSVSFSALKRYIIQFVEKKSKTILLSRIEKMIK